MSIIEDEPTSALTAAKPIPDDSPRPARTRGKAAGFARKPHLIEQRKRTAVLTPRISQAGAPRVIGMRDCQRRVEPFALVVRQGWKDTVEVLLILLPECLGLV
jgi:hypothetical protein